MEIKFNLSSLKQNNKKTFKKEKWTINPDKYWIFILSLNFIVFVSLGVFGYFLFLRVNEAYSSADPGVVKAGIKEDRLKNSLLLFENRSKKSEEIKINPAPVVDPSI